MADMVASQVHTISTHKGDITSLAFSNDKLATVSGDKTVRLWSTDDYSELPCSPLLGHSYIIHYCTFSPFGTILATCSTDGKLILWEPRSGEVKAEFQHPSKSSIRVCKFSPDSTRIASGGDDDTICLWEIATRKLIRYDTVCLWEIATRKLIRYDTICLWEIATRKLIRYFARLIVVKKCIVLRG